MNVRVVALFLIASLCSATHAAQPKPDEPPTGPDRVVNGRLLNVDGSPCANAVILPIGLDRGGIIMQDQALKNPLWQYRTDKDGRFTVRFGHFLNSDDQATSSTLGWSYYYLIALPGKDDAGAVSDMIGNPRSTPENPQEKLNEWGPVHYLGAQMLEITMQRKAGIVVEGTVFDKTGRELAGTTVSLNHDLHAGSHTGYGGEIFKRSTATDARGHYRFEHVYPAKFNIDCGRQDRTTTSPTIWLRTRIGEGEWQDDRVDEIDVKPGDTMKRIDIELSPWGQFVYRGFVTDEAGKPIEGADVVLGYSSHAQLKNYGDFHSFLHAKTATDGSYEIKSGTGWVRFLSARKEGYQDEDINSDLEEDNGRKLPPGRYDFKLKKNAPGAGNP